MGTGGVSPWLTGIVPAGRNLRSVSVVAKEFGAERVFVRALQDWNFQCLLKRKVFSSTAPLRMDYGLIIAQLFLR